MNSLISDGKVVNKSNGNKDSYWINLNWVDITNESALNLNFLPNTPIGHTEPTTNGPTPDFNIIEETSKTFRIFERIKIEDLKKEIILVTKKILICAFKRS